jgi:hypothetical protein
MEGNTMPDEKFQIVGWTGVSRGSKWKDWGSFADVCYPPLFPPGPRKNVQPFVNPIMRETLPHYSGNSYLRIMHGEAEIILIGEYLTDGNGRQVTRGTFSDDFTQVVGDSFIVDGFDVAESDSLYGTYLSEILTGSIFSGNRGVAIDGATRNAKSGSNVQRFVKMSSDSSLIHDLFFSGVNESPASAFRNAPEPSSFVSTPLDKIIGGKTESSGSFFRGKSALKRKPAIKLSAYFRTNHWGFFSDLVEGVENTKTYEVGSPGSGLVSSAAVKVRFVTGSMATDGANTTSQNISKTSEVVTPYVDGESNSREIDTMIVTT